MDLAITADDLPILTEYVRLPNRVWNGRYNDKGEIWTGGRCQEDEDMEGTVFITTKGTAFIWCVFQHELLAGQRADMIITNAPGSFLAGVSFTEWDPKENQPCISNSLFTLISSQRSRDSLRIVGRNHSDRDLPAAVGVVLADDAPYNSRGG
jgi:hypothetical protein